MIEDLRDYPLSEIEFAFREWRREQRIIPTPADIIAIVERALAAKRASHYTPPEGRTHWPTEEEKAEVTKICEKIYKNLRSG